MAVTESRFQGMASKTLDRNLHGCGSAARGGRGQVTADDDPGHLEAIMQHTQQIARQALAGGAK